MTTVSSPRMQSGSGDKCWLVCRVFRSASHDNNVPTPLQPTYTVSIVYISTRMVLRRKNPVPSCSCGRRGLAYPNVHHQAFSAVGEVILTSKISGTDRVGRICTIWSRFPRMSSLCAFSNQVFTPHRNHLTCLIYLIHGVRFYCIFHVFGAACAMLIMLPSHISYSPSYSEHLNFKF
ncbi:hypothetical protein F5I97DRAFT_1458178 [Phlebopus sp. FC_14]|nr:hypothetical protein F5I97DRAFT_1458178 [Phlebopus sp. FC_14]